MAEAQALPVMLMDLVAQRSMKSKISGQAVAPANSLAVSTGQRVRTAKNRTTRASAPTCMHNYHAHVMLVHCLVHGQMVDEAALHQRYGLA